MSLTIKSKSTRKQLINFLASEYKKNTGIPVHLYSIVNATFSAYNKCAALTDNLGVTMILEESKLFKSYGQSNPVGLIKTLNSCNAGLTII